MRIPGNLRCLTGWSLIWKPPPMKVVGRYGNGNHRNWCHAGRSQRPRAGSLPAFRTRFGGLLLTPFCRELTHITQANIDAAQPSARVWAAFERWLGQHHARLEGWVSWGDYDRKQLLQDWQRLALDSALSRGAAHESQAALCQGPAPGTTLGTQAVPCNWQDCSSAGSSTGRWKTRAIPHACCPLSLRFREVTGPWALCILAGPF